MVEPHFVTLKEMEDDRLGFIELVRKHGHVFIEGATGLYSVAHRISAADEVGPITQRFYEWDLSPIPSDGPIGRMPTASFWMGRYVNAPGLQVNVLNLQRFANGLVILVESGQPVIVLQNLVPGVTHALASLSISQLQLLYPLDPSDPVTPA